VIENLIQLYHASVHVVNLPYTLLLSLVMLYWITVLIGALEMDALDISDADLSGGSVAGVFEGFLEYFNLRKVPVSIIASVFALSLWLVGVLANHYLHNTSSRLLGLLILVPNVLISAHVAKYATRPLVPLFRSMRADVSDRRDLVGCRVIVTSSQADASYGQAEIREEGAPITLSVRTDGETLPKGTEAVILYVDTEKHVYIISKLEV